MCGSRFEWVECRNGKVPSNAIIAGNTDCGEKLYIGRANYRDSLTVGKIHPSHRCLYIPFDGREIAEHTYEVLVQAINRYENRTPARNPYENRIPTSNTYGNGAQVRRCKKMFIFNQIPFFLIF